MSGLGLKAGLVEPMNHQVVILQDIEDATTTAGIHLTDAARSKFRTGVIVAKADDCDQPIEVGDRVSWQKFAGMPIKMKLEGKEQPLIVMHEQSITMKVGDGVLMDGGDS